MMEAQPFGSLLINGERPTAEQIAALTVTPIPVVKKAMKELRERGVYSVDEDGTIYSRRMRRDAKRKIEAKQNGKLGGNPRLIGKDKPADKPPDNPTPTEGLTPLDKPQGNIPSPIPTPSSDPNGSGANGAADPVKALFDFGRSILIEAGQTDQKARALVGGWRRDLRDDSKLMAILVSAKKNHAQAPVPYIETAIKREKAGLFSGGYTPMHPGAGG